MRKTPEGGERVQPGDTRVTFGTGPVTDGQPRMRGPVMSPATDSPRPGEPIGDRPSILSPNIDAGAQPRDGSGVQRRVITSAGGGDREGDTRPDQEKGVKKTPTIGLGHNSVHKRLPDGAIPDDATPRDRGAVAGTGSDGTDVTELEALDWAREEGRRQREAAERGETNPTDERRAREAAGETHRMPDLDEVVGRVRKDQFADYNRWYPNERLTGSSYGEQWAGLDPDETNVKNQQYANHRSEDYTTNAEAVEITADALVTSGKDPSARERGGTGEVRDSDMWGREAVQTAEALDRLRHKMLEEVADQAEAADAALKRGDITPEEHQAHRARVEEEARDDIAERIKGLTGRDTTDRYYYPKGEGDEPVTFDNAPEALMYAGAQDSEGLRQRGEDRAQGEPADESDRSARARDADYAGHAADATSGEDMRSREERHRELREYWLVGNAIVAGRVPGRILRESEPYIDARSGEVRHRLSHRAVVSPGRGHTQAQTQAEVIKYLKLEEATKQGRGGRVVDTENSTNPYGLRWDEQTRDWVPPAGGSTSTGRSSSSSREHKDHTGGWPRGSEGTERSDRSTGPRAIGTGSGAERGSRHETSTRLPDITDESIPQHLRTAALRYGMGVARTVHGSASGRMTDAERAARQTTAIQAAREELARLLGK